MKTTLCGLLVIIFAYQAMPALANDWQDGVMSGLATNALVRAYQASGLDGAEPPPLRLQKYVVTIRAQGDSFEVFFLAQTEAVAIPLVVSARNGAIVWKEGDKPNFATLPINPGGRIFPGIIAGEIIAAG
jgi:hypothetical protein